MKGFKKDGKFIPTGNKTKSNLKKSDVRKKQTVGVKEVNNILRTKNTIKKSNLSSWFNKLSIVGKQGLSDDLEGDEKYSDLSTKQKNEIESAYNLGYSDREDEKRRSKESIDEPKQTFGEFLKSGHYLEGEIKERAKKGSPHWFDDDSMRFFSSRVTNLMWKKDDDIYFVSSEENKSFGEFSGTPRAYTVRVVGTDGDINDVGGFQAYETVNQARHAIQDILEGNE